MKNKVSYKYKVATNYLNGLESTLNFYGKEGWLLHHVIFVPGQSSPSGGPLINIILIKKTEEV